MEGRLIVRIVCGKEVGTAFYVAPDLLLTAYHTVACYSDDAENIVKDSTDGDLHFEVIRNIEEFDISILKVSARSEKDFYGLQAHHLRIDEDVESFGYPDKNSDGGLRLYGKINQKVYGKPANYQLCPKDISDLYDYQGMSGAPILIRDKVVGIVIEQTGNHLSFVSVEIISSVLTEIKIEKEESINSIPASIGKDVEKSQPNYSVFESLDTVLSNDKSHWILLYGSPGCGKTTVAGGFESRTDRVKILGRFFFKVPNDDMSRAIRCSEGYFVDWIETVFVATSCVDVKKLTPEEKRKSVSDWFRYMSNILSVDDKSGVIIIDGLDELVTDRDNRIDDILSLLPESLPSNIKVVLSCISEDILPATIIGKLLDEFKIEVTPLNMQACESYIKANSGEWEKTFPFIQAVAHKTQGHPLYMNYLCRYMVESFDEKTKEVELEKWLDSLPTIGGDITAYYESIWKKANPKGCAFEVLALLSQIRGSVLESQLLNMMVSPNPYDFKLSIREFRHLLKEKDAERYEIYHSSFRLFVTHKLGSIIGFTNDQIGKYCLAHKDLPYSIENTLHHLVNGSDVLKGLEMCNQEWADLCAMHDVSPDLIMHDIKECLALAVDNGLPIEVIRLMLLAQRIENRCDSIMVDHVDAFIDLSLLRGKPDVAMKYIVRDNRLLVDLPRAMSYLRIMFELNYKEQALDLAESIEAKIRQILEDKSQKYIDTYVFVAKGFLIVEGVLAGVENQKDLVGYLTHTLNYLKADTEEQTNEMISSIRSEIIAYQLSNHVRSGKIVDFDKHLKRLDTNWDERIVMLLINVIHLYEVKDSELHKIGYNESFNFCLKKLEDVLLQHDFAFSNEDIKKILAVLIGKPIQACVIKKLLGKYKPELLPFSFRNANGVDVEVNSVFEYYIQSFYKAYEDDVFSLPELNRNYKDDGSWEKYIEMLVARTAYIHGLLRMRTDGDDLSSIYVKFKDILDCLDFSFEERINWKRSYLLPEKLIPFLYTKLAEIYGDFFADRIDDLMEHVKSRMSNQLCLYREGYCDTLIGMAKILGEKNMRMQALFFADEAVKFILYAVMNRWERCNYLLQLCCEYARWGETLKVQTTYAEVLKSSMGPDWYKEAQLDLINEFRKSDIPLDAVQVAHMAAIFEEASGEMTFQRYVQQEKNEFVATIAKTSSLSDAIGYYMFETLPSPESIICNAEEWKVDMPKLGDGYDLGANHLIEASAICQLLRECKAISPYIRYAISELFWENWDKLHNDNQYASLHSEIIVELGLEKSIEILAPRMAEYIVSDYDNKKGEYLKDFEETTTSNEFFDALKQNLRKHNYKWERTESEEKTSEKRESLQERLGLLPSSKVLLDNMRKSIISPVGTYWFSLSEFITPLINMPDFDRCKLYDVISSHYNINVQPSRQQDSKFSWMKGFHKEINQDEQMIHFLIWFLVHPDNSVSKRASGVLKWLSTYDTRVIKCLIEEILYPCEVGLNTEASSVLLNIAMMAPSLVLESFQDIDIKKKLLSVCNFSVSWNLYEIALLLSDKCGYCCMLEELQHVIPESLPDRSDVLFENDDKMFVSTKIDALNYWQVTGGKEFAKPYLDAVHRLQGDGTLDRLFQSDRYIHRSFYLGQIFKGRCARTMEDILNNVLYGKVDIRRASDVYNVINS